jgi:hypothetical protein
VEERRAMDTRMEVITTQFINLVAQIDREEKTALEWRNLFNKKLDEVSLKLDNLPCNAAAVDRKTMRTDIGWLQKGAVVLISCLFGVGVWVGVMGNTVASNTKKWEVLEPEHQTLIKDVEVLKQVSYGWQDAHQKK